MIEVDHTLIVSILQGIQRDVAAIRREMHDFRVRVGALEGHVTGLIVSVQLANERLDRPATDTDLVTRRLDLVDA